MATNNDTEAARLGQLYEILREKLLDLTKRNRMLNYSLGARSKRHLQIFDEVPEETYRRLVTGNLSFELCSLPEPDDIPKDEKTEEFISALEHAKVSDIEYLTRLQVLENTGRDDDQSLIGAERELRTRVRAQLGMPPRPKRNEINRNDHARTFGVEPNPELPKQVTKRTHSDKKLQTLKFPDELEAVVEKIVDDARLAEQEMGLSTLFLAFGFLEWYDSDSSDKKYLAPLLLLPVKIEGRVANGKKLFSLAASAGSVDANLSLQKYLRVQFGRELPDFELDDEEASGSIEAYFDQVNRTIDGLSRWRVHRWIILGHFAFGRLAMYADLAPEKWKNHPTGNPLVKTILAGTEYRDDGGLPSIPEDYEIDDPEIEKIAPFLIHDADASQHSALVDAGKGQNLVIQGPPGTGKSQTITNMIANALAAGKKVLFLAEKQAALEVVKRRLDRAQLGEFCLEIHSDKSSSKQVVKSLQKRIDLGFGNGRAISNPRSADATWLDSRKTISDYVNSLNGADDDGETPFDLMWKSIRGRSLEPTIVASFKNVELPLASTENPSEIPSLLGQLDVYASAAQSFSESYGHPAKSPWVDLRVEELPNYEIGELIDALSHIKVSAEALLGIAQQNSELATSRVDELRSLVSAAQDLPHPPSEGHLARVLPLDLQELEETLAKISQLNEIKKSLQEKPGLASAPIEIISRAIEIANVNTRDDVLNLSPRAMFSEFEHKSEALDRLISVINGLTGALKVLDFDTSLDVKALEAVAISIAVVSKLEPQHRPWLSRFREKNIQLFEAAKNRWTPLVEAERAWRARCAIGESPWPPPEEIENAADILGKGKIGKLFAKIGGSEKKAKQVVSSLRFNPNTSPTSDDLRQLASHVRDLKLFSESEHLGDLLGEAWKGLHTPLNDINVGMRVRSFLIEKVSGLPGGHGLIERLLALSADQLGLLGSYVNAADAFRAVEKELEPKIANSPVRGAMMILKREQSQIQKTLEVDPARQLLVFDSPIRDIAWIAGLRIRQQELEASLSRSLIEREARSLAVDDNSLQSTQIAIDWIRAVRSLDVPPPLRDKMLGPGGAGVGDRVLRFGSELEKPFVQYDANMEGISGRLRLEVPASGKLEDLIERVRNLISRRNELFGYLALKAQRKVLEEQGLKAFLQKTDEIALLPAQLSSTLSILVAHKRADKARRTNRPLAQLSGPILDAKRQAFADRDKKKLIGDRGTIYARLLPAKPIPGNRSGRKKTWTEMALIENEINKEQGFIPIRNLITRAGYSLLQLTPCFMMSPLSLAKFLPALNTEFDLTIIDEASQMRPEDALGGALRSKQIVVVGDPKQLPPTDFFNRADGSTKGLGEDEEDFEDVDDESILEACQKAFQKVRRLKWHYRSRCESLIAFSNREFYGNSLITFPTARPKSFSIDLIQVKGSYQGRRNVAEALRVAEEAMRFMRHHAKDDEDSVPTLGIAAVNIEQRDLIRGELRRLWAGDELVEEFQTKVEKKGEPVFVRNLENVQGDERDFILISMTYGYEPGATALKQRFGPINGKQGHRRLNVLFSRARQRIGLFASFGSADIKLTENSNEGVHVLQRYLAYAEGQGRAAVENVGVQVDSDFEAAVADRLRANGYAVDYQVGVSGFRIDLGVRHPEKPEMFLAGIECDGAQYHSSKSARDRDRLREEILNGLGWTILRVWSTDWFENPDEETRKLIVKLKTLTSKRPTADVSDQYQFGTKFESERSIEAISDAVPIYVRGQIESPRAAQEIENDSRSDSNGVVSPIAVSNERLSSGQAQRELRQFRESVIAKEMDNWEPERSILREGMIETFVATRLSDSFDWFRRIPQYQRQNTNPIEKQKYLETICEIVGRIDK